MVAELPNKSIVEDDISQSKWNKFDNLKSLMNEMAKTNNPLLDIEVKYLDEVQEYDEYTELCLEASEHQGGNPKVLWHSTFLQFG